MLATATMRLFVFFFHKKVFNKLLFCCLDFFGGLTVHHSEVSAIAIITLTFEVSLGNVKKMCSIQCSKLAVLEIRRKGNSSLGE